MRSLLCIIGASGLLFAACSKDKTVELPSEETTYTIEVVATPERKIYLPDERVEVQALVRDGEGRLVEGIPVIWRQKGAIEDGDQRFRLQGRESLAEVTACIAEQVAVDDERYFDADDDGLIATDVCDTALFPVDNAPPALVVTSPEPGAELDRSEESNTVLVEGTIEDTNEDARLQVIVNNTIVEIQPDGSFSAEVPLEFGINRISVEGTDGFHEPVVHSMDVLAADGWLQPEEGTTRFDLADTLGVRITQKFFDRMLGGTHIDATELPISVNDLASIVEVLLVNMDLSSVFGTEPVLDEDEITLSVKSVTVGDAIVDIAILDGRGLALQLNVNDVYIGTDGELNLLDNHFLLEGGLRADLNAALTIELEVSEDGQISSDMTVDSFGVTGIRPEFTGNHGEFFNALITLGSVQRTFQEIIEDQVGGELINEFIGVVPDTITELLGSIGGILDDVGFDIDIEFAPPMRIQLGSSLGGLTLQGGADTGFLDARLNASVEVSSDAGPQHADSKGLPMPSIDPLMPFNNLSSIQLAIRQDFVNGLLHGVWNAGLLSGGLSFNGLDIVLDAKLPPVLIMAPLNTSCRIDGVRCDAVIQIGQFQVEALGTLFGLSIQAGATVAFQGNDIVLKVSEEPDVRVWLLSEEAGLLNVAAVESLVFNVVWPEVTGLIGEGFSFSLPLPSPAELGLGELAPALSDAELTLRALGRIRSQSGYLGLGADIVLSTP